MSARKIGTSWWVDFSFHRARHRVRSPDNSYRGALAYEGLLRERLARGEPLLGTPPAPPVRTFGEFSKDWFDKHVRTNDRLSEQRSKQGILRWHLVPSFGNLPLDQIRGERIELYKAEKRASGLAAKTINNHLAVLSKCLRTAEAWGVLPAAPEIVWLKARPERIDFLSFEEREKLLADREEPLWHELIHFALCTGLRRGELMALDWSDVNLERRILTVRQALVCGVIGPPKNNRVRYLELGPRLCATLKARHRRQGLVFCQPDGRPFTDGMMTKAMRRICRRAGIRHVSWHVLRHSVASYLAWRGHPMLTIQKMLGHSSVTMTERYAHLAPALLGHAASDLERDIGSGPAIAATGGQWAASADANLSVRSDESRPAEPHRYGEKHA